MEERNALLRKLPGSTVRVIVDRPIGYCHKGLIYPVNYGYLPGILAGDGEEQDAYILGVDTPLKEFTGVVIGAAVRRDDCEDKLIVAPDGMVFSREQVVRSIHFQEQFFDTEILMWEELKI